MSAWGDPKGLLWGSQGVPVEIPNGFYGDPKEFLWGPQGVPMGIPRGSCGVPKGFLWGSRSLHGVSGAMQSVPPPPEPCGDPINPTVRLCWVPERPSNPLQIPTEGFSGYPTDLPPQALFGILYVPCVGAIWGYWGPSWIPAGPWCAAGSS